MNKDVLRKAICTRTPMRVTLGGGGTDVLWYSKLKGGAWISAAIDKYVYIQVKHSFNSRIFKIEDNEGQILEERLDAISNPIIQECLNETGFKGGVELLYYSDILPKSGLGGSGAFEVGLLNALYNLKQQPASSRFLAEKASAIEIDKLHKPVGPQDQYIAALGGIYYFEIDTKGKISFEPLHLSDNTLNGLKENLVFFQTNKYHETAVILNYPKNAIKNVNERKIIKSLDQIKDLGQEVKHFLLSGQIDQFGESLHRHWVIKKKLSSSITDPEIDFWYEQGLKNGALGGKIMGAGGGGWFMFYVNKNKQTFINKMTSLGLIHQKAQFEFSGSKVVSEFAPQSKTYFDFNSQDTQLDAYLDNYLGGILSVVYKLNKEPIKNIIHELVELRKNKGRLFMIGVGGSAANCSHAVNDFRKIAGIESYAPTDNVSELTARTNDDGWETIFINWLKGSNITANDAVLVLSVGGGDEEKKVSVNIVKALEYSQEVGAKIFGIVSRNGGYTKKVANQCIIIPVIQDETITPYAESLQAVLWHAIAFSPNLKL